MTGDVDAVAILEPFAAFWDIADELRTNDDKPGAKARQQPLEIIPGVVEVSYRIKPPLGFRARALPTPLAQALGPGSFTAAATTLNDGTVDVVFRIDTVKPLFTVEEVTAFRRAANALRLDAWSRVVFDSDVALATKAGKTKEGLELARALASQQPQIGAHQARLARALLEAGFGDLAREAARRGTVLAPQDPVAWRGLGFALEHDSLGRRFHPQFDLDGAVAAYRKAQAIKPEATTIGATAWVLEHNARGERWGTGARLEEAIAEYRELARVQKSHEADPYILGALLYLHRYDEVLARAPEAPQTSSRNEFWVAALAASRGVPAALAQAEQLTASDEARRALLKQAGAHLLRLRAYAEANAISQAAMGQQADASSRSLLAVLARLRTPDKWGFGAADPRFLAARLHDVVFESDPQSAALELFASEVHEGPKRNNLTPGDRAAWAFIAQVRNAQVPREVLLDLSIASFEWTVVGDERNGWRVRGVPLTVLERPLDIYVVRQGKSLRVLGMPTILWTLGLRALRLAQSGEAAQARQWLTWARESVSLREDAGGELWLSYLELSHPADLVSDTGVVTAATVLALHGPAEVPMSLLNEAQKSATGNQVKASLNWLLATHFAEREQWDLSLNAAERFATLEPNSSAAFNLRTHALIKLGRGVEAEKLATSRLTDLPADENAQHALVAVAYSKGDVIGARKLAEQRRTSGRATAADYNQLAWDGLVLGLTDAETYESAQRASQLTNGKNSAILNTYAAVSAATGRPAEAHKLLLESLAVDGDVALRAGDWLVIGLIAEEYALTDAARSAFEKTVSTESFEDPAIASSVIAKARLAKLTNPSGKSNSNGKQ